MGFSTGASAGDSTPVNVNFFVIVMLKEAVYDVVEAGHMVLLKRLVMMLVTVEVGHVGHVLLISLVQ